MKLLIRGGRVIDPATKTDEVMDLLIEDGTIIARGKALTEMADQVIDAQGKWVTPGLIDVHVHLREPGYEYKETIHTGSKAAVMGGYTTICCMPNTDPVVDNEIMVEYIKMKAAREGYCHVLPIGAITKGQEGKELANIGRMVKAGACGISEDGKSVMDAGLLKTAMKYSKMFDIPVMSHCEDKSLVGGGVMNAGTQAQLLGLKGISNDSEEVIIARDILLARATGARLHLCHVSTKGGIALIEDAKRHGQEVSAEITPHHFTLCDRDVLDYDANTKMNPPLRSMDDVLALRQALKDDVVNIIATDHAPHSEDEKNCEYERAPFGIVGLETAFALGNTVLVQGGWLTPMQLIAKMSTNPARLIHLDKGSLEVGKTADISIFDPEAEVVVCAADFASKGHNTPFDGWKVQGKVCYTIVDGQIRMAEGVIQE
ncbi:MAG TPA: dihydroorotase [Firmicutes bacterium]|nr:dihydroorotase [Bacillota bacterium]